MENSREVIEIIKDMGAEEASNYLADKSIGEDERLWCAASVLCFVRKLIRAI